MEPVDESIIEQVFQMGPEVDGKPYVPEDHIMPLLELGGDAQAAIEEGKREPSGFNGHGKDEGDESDDSETESVGGLEELTPSKSWADKNTEEKEALMALMPKPEITDTNESEDAFVEYCENLCKDMGIEKLPGETVLKPYSGDDNMDKVLIFLRNASHKFPVLCMSKTSILCDFVGCDALEVEKLLVTIARPQTKRKMVSKPQSAGSSRVDKTSSRLKDIQNMIDETSNVLGRTPGDPSTSGFKEYCNDLASRIGLLKVSPAADLRRKDEEDIFRVRQFLEHMIEMFPQMEEEHVQYLNSISGPNIQTVRNFLLFRFRQKFGGSTPCWVRESVKKKKRSKPMRIPWDSAKGLGCSKCRFAQNGCNTCGYYPEGAIPKTDSTSSSKKKSKKQSKPKQIVLSTGAKVFKKITIKPPKPPKDLIKEAKKRAATASKSLRAAKQAMLNQHKEQLEREKLDRVAKALEAIPCARSLAYRGKAAKSEIYGGAFHVSKTTVLKNHARPAASNSSALNKQVGKLSRGKNSLFKKLEVNSLVKIGKSPVHAWGLFASQKIRKGTQVIEYIGELTRLILAEKRENLYENGGLDSSYMFRVGANLIDATISGGPARYINHSCNPNCAPKQHVKERKIFIYAIRDIEEGEELFYDYKFDYEGEEKRVSCCCGAYNCRGYMN